MAPRRCAHPCEGNECADRLADRGAKRVSGMDASRLGTGRVWAVVGGGDKQKEAKSIDQHWQQFVSDGKEVREFFCDCSAKAKRISAGVWVCGTKRCGFRSYD